jgi:hypothetical protein
VNRKIDHENHSILTGPWAWAVPVHPASITPTTVTTHARRSPRWFAIVALLSPLEVELTPDCSQHHSENTERSAEVPSLRATGRVAATSARFESMTRLVGPALTPDLVERFAQRDLSRRLGVGLPFVTVDSAGRPHPMLLSYLELRAYDARTLGLVILARSTSARNLAERHVGTLILVEPDAVVYVKTRAVDGPLPVAGGEAFGLGFFLLEVEQVLEDAPADWESGTRITESIRYAPAPTLEEPWARATLAALAAPRARA